MEEHNRSRAIKIVLGCFIFSMTYQGIINNTFTLFIISITQDFGCPRSSVTLIQTISMFCTVLGSISVWSVYERLGMLRTQRIIAFLLPVVYFGYSEARSLPFFYLLAAMRGFMTGLATTTAIVHILKSSFPSSYGMPLGIALMGAGCGGFVFNNVAAQLMRYYTWRQIIKFQAVLIFALVIFASFVLIHQPDKHEEVLHHSRKAFHRARKRLDDDHPERGRLIMCLTYILAFGFCIGNLTNTPTPYFQDLGYSTSFAAFAMSLGLVASALGKPVEGTMVDKYGIKGVSVIAFLGTAGCLLSLIFFKTTLMLVPFLLCTFMSDAYSTVGVSLVPGFVFDESMRERAVGLSNGMQSFGFGISPFLSGYVFDLCGSYVPMYIVSLLLLIATFPLFYSVLTNRRKKTKTAAAP